MTINPNDAAASLQEIAAVEHRTRQAFFYAGSSAIFIMWGVLIACGYAVGWYAPETAGTSWLGINALGCILTAAIVGWRFRERSREARTWRLVWAMLVVMVFGEVWTHLLGPIVPTRLIESFGASLFLLCMILAGIWIGRAFIVLGSVGLALITAAAFQAEPWLTIGMAVVQSGTYIIGGLWLHKHGATQ
jgi:hypothetical protein